MNLLCRLCLWLCTALLCTAASAQDRPFIVVQTMNYKGGVDLTPYGIRYNPIVYESSLLPSTTSDEPASQEALKKMLDAVIQGPLPVVLDIERWPVGEKDPEQRREHVDKLMDVLKRVRQARPDMKFGYYGEVPARVYWPIIDPNQRAQRGAWTAGNERAKKDFVPYVDAVFPSLYTFYDDPKGWEAYAKAMLVEARQYNKPTYCYLWPQFHPSNKKLVGQYLSADFWRLELETCRKYADGIVIWNHAPQSTWDPEAPWWKETAAFMQAQGLAPKR